VTECGAGDIHLAYRGTRKTGGRCC